MADQKPPVEIVHTDDTEKDDIGIGQSVAPQVSPHANQPEMPAAVETAAPPATEAHSHWCEFCHSRRFDCLCRNGQWGICPDCIETAGAIPYLHVMRGRIEVGGSGFLLVDDQARDAALAPFVGRKVAITVRGL